MSYTPTLIIWVSIGKIGEFYRRAIWRRLGMTMKIRDRVYEVSGIAVHYGSGPRSRTADSRCRRRRNRAEGCR